MAREKEREAEGTREGERVGEKGRDGKKEGRMWFSSSFAQRLSWFDWDGQPHAGGLRIRSHGPRWGRERERENKLRERERQRRRERCTIFPVVL